MIGIYKIVSPTNKIYVGQSIDIEKRKDYYKKIKCKKQPKLYNSLLKYGWEGHKFEIIEECSLEQLNEQEIYWGIKYEVLNENGLNLKLGDANGFCSEETKQKLRKPKPIYFKGNIGNKHSEDALLKMRKPRINTIKMKGSKKPFKRTTSSKLTQSLSLMKSILQYDLNGNFIKEWKSIKTAGETLSINKGGISRCLSGELKKFKNSNWKYKSNE